MNRIWMLNARSRWSCGASLVLLWTLLVVRLSNAGEWIFEPPDKATRLKAIGATAGLPENLRRAFDPAKAFKAIPRPGAQDWLTAHEEHGQTFRQFLTAKTNRAVGERSKIYFQPLGPFPRDRSPSLDHLKEYARAFFAMEVEILPAIHQAAVKVKTRINRFTGKRQLLTGDVLEFLRKKLPKDAYCVLAITMSDLYPGDKWNFVFGQASLRGRVGVYSFARYDPMFFGDRRQGNYQKTLLRRSCKVLVHETAHMFGMEHCIYFSCILNGSNHLRESDSRPPHLCPVCLRKLWHTVHFDIVDRYDKIKGFYKKVGFDEDAAWIGKRRHHVLAKDP